MWILDANVAGGKSTFLAELRSRDQRFEPIFENVEEFASFKSFNPLYEAYNCPARAASICQLHILNCIHRQLFEISNSRKYKDKIFISERSLFSPLVFNRAHERCGTISRFVQEFVSEEVSRRASETIKVLDLRYEGVLYLHTEVDVCLERLALRGRYNEKDRITADYLSALEQEYEIHLDSWREQLGNDRVYKLVTAGKSPVELVDEFSQHLGWTGLWET